MITHDELNPMRRAAKQVVEKLQAEGYEAYFAGGAVRDMLLGQPSKDIDIATSAKPDEVEAIFKRTISVGKSYGVIKALENNHNFDVATFRKESEYLDNRRPSKITFARAKQDAIRRDFTINGLFYDPVAQKIIDFVGGQEDIKKKTIRFIGDPDERISEDHLRLIRAIRFKVTLEFQYEPATFNAVRKNHDLIENVSRERVRDELNVILRSPKRHQGLVELSESGLLLQIIPEIESLKSLPQPIEYHREGDAFVHTYLALKSLPVNTSEHLAWAILLHDIGKAQTLVRQGKKIIFHDHARISAEMAVKILRRLKFPNVEISTISWLIANHMRVGDISKMRPIKALDFVTDPRFDDLIKLTRADSKGTYPVNLEMVRQMEKAEHDAYQWKQQKKSIKKQQLLTGDDLIKIGLKPGKNFKKIIDDINDLTVAGKLKTKDESIQLVKKRYLNE